MKRKILPTFLYLSFGLVVGLLGAEVEPVIDLQDPKAIQKEYKRIQEQYKDDLPKLTEELNKFSRTLAKRNGTEERLDKRLGLLKKYGPVLNMTELTNSTPDRELSFVDNGAWQTVLERVNGRTLLTFYLDKTRYAGSQPTNLSVQLRRLGKDHEEEILFWDGKDTPASFRVDLPFTQPKEGVFMTSFLIPDEEKPRFVVQIKADIEKGWSTNSVVRIK